MLLICLTAWAIVPAMLSSFAVPFSRVKLLLVSSAVRFLTAHQLYSVPETSKV